MTNNVATFTIIINNTDYLNIHLNSLGGKYNRKEYHKLYLFKKIIKITFNQNELTKSIYIFLQEIFPNGCTPSGVQKSLSVIEQLSVLFTNQ